jgi:hypothetical protein
VTCTALTGRDAPISKDDMVSYSRFLQTRTGVAEGI